MKALRNSLLASLAAALLCIPAHAADFLTGAVTNFPDNWSVKDGTTTIPSSEYTVGYSNNTNVGTATVTITDKSGGNYTVSGSKTFSITSAALSGVTVTSYEGTYDGSAHTISVTVPSGATVKYGTASGTYNLTAAPAYTDVCNNTV